MNSKQRVAAALRREVPDKVPYGEFAIDFDTAERILGHKTYHRNKAGAQVAIWEGRWDEVAESVVRDSAALVEAVDQDIVSAGILPARDAEKPRKIDDTTYEYKDGRILKYSAATNDFTVVQYPQKDWLPTDKDLETVAQGERFEDYRLAPVRNLVAKFGRDKFVVTGVPYELGMPLFGGMENGLIYYLTDSGRIRAYMDAALEGARKNDAFYKSLGCDAAFWGADYAYNAGPFLSPPVFADLIAPYLKARVADVHALRLPVIQHACGNNWPILDHFVDARIDCYQSIQNSAGMDLRPLKEQYGSRIALWGGIPVEDLVSGTPSDITRDVEYAIRWGKPGGGYIFGASHSIAVGTKYENYMRMLEEFNRQRDY